MATICTDVIRNLQCTDDGQVIITSAGGKLTMDANRFTFEGPGAAMEYFGFSVCSMFVRPGIGNYCRLSINSEGGTLDFVHNGVLRHLGHLPKEMRTPVMQDLVKRVNSLMASWG